MSPLHLLFGFRGRIARETFAIWFPLVLVAGLAVAYAAYAGIGVLAAILNPRGLNAGLVVIGIWWAAYVLTTWALLALLVKRLHDRDRRAWWAVWGIVPLSAIILLNWTPLLEGAKWVGWAAAQPFPLYALRVLFIIKCSGILFFLLVEAFMLTGSAGPNRFGPAPLDRRHDGAATEHAEPTR